MLENDAEYTSVHDADIHVCIFPHLDEFILLDYRDSEHPALRVVPASELLTPQYFQEIEKEFSRILYSGEAPFVNLMTLPQRLEHFLKAQGLHRLTSMLPPGSGPPGSGKESPRVSVFLCSGAIINMGEEELSAFIDSFFEDGPPQQFVRDYTATFMRLLEAERISIRSRELDELRRAVKGHSNQFFTIWQEKPEPS